MTRLRKLYNYVTYSVNNSLQLEYPQKNDKCMGLLEELKQMCKQMSMQIRPVIILETGIIPRYVEEVT
jgi:hypothetical protein